MIPGNRLLGEWNEATMTNRIALRALRRRFLRGRLPPYQVVLGSGSSMRTCLMGACCNVTVLYPSYFPTIEYTEGGYIFDPVLRLASAESR